ncbi:hypothetical protein [Streptomyces eurythermus]|uniref:hypothetical protein n=1 Tax=Streptomyces eurythermus TaxID=42237 RepID=UPI0033F2242E
MNRSRTRRVFLDGPARSADPLRQRLALHPGTEVLVLEPDASPSSRQALMAAADLTVVCRDDDAAVRAVRLATGTGARILDLSAAHRTACGWIYGLPELARPQRDRITRGHAVAQPDSRAAAATLLLRPLNAVGLLPSSASCATEAVSASGADVAREMVKWGRLPRRPECPAGRTATADEGVVHITVHAPEPLRPGSLRDCLADVYRGQRYLRVAEEDGGPADAQALTLSVRSAPDGAVRLTARMPATTDWALDLAVRNVNLMLGLPEDLGVLDGTRPAGTRRATPPALHPSR